MPVVPVSSSIPPGKPPPPTALVPATVIVSGGSPVSTQGPVTLATIKGASGTVLGLTVAMADTIVATVQLLDGTVSVWEVYLPAGTQPWHFPFGPGLLFGTEIVLTSTSVGIVNVSVR